VIFGFNTNVRLGGQTYHVQSEDRSARAVLETIVFTQGRVIHRQATSYAELVGTREFNDEALRGQLERQHREVVDALRAGLLGAEVPAEPGIEVQLLNPASWLVAGMARLDVEVKHRGSGQPVAGAAVQVLLPGSQGTLCFSARTDQAGRVHFKFPLPRLGPAGTELVIHAGSAIGEDQIRYQLPAKPSAAS